jgi:hypothetical protein
MIRTRLAEPWFPVVGLEGSGLGEVAGYVIGSKRRAK